MDTAYYTEVASNDLVTDESLFWVRGIASERRGTENVALHDEWFFNGYGWVGSIFMVLFWGLLCLLLILPSLPVSCCWCRPSRVAGFGIEMAHHRHDGWLHGQYQILLGNWT